MYLPIKIYNPMIYNGRLERHELIRMDVLPLDVNCWHRGSDLEATRPLSGSKSLIWILELNSGIPKYVMEKEGNFLLRLYAIR